MWKKGIVLVLLLCLSGLSGCSNAQQKAVTGTILGGIAGGIIGHQNRNRDKGIAIGATSGALLGYMIGNEQDKEALKRGRRGHYETREQKTWVPGYTEKRWTPARYDTRYDACGEPYQILVEEGHFDQVVREGHWNTKKVKVWVDD